MKTEFIKALREVIREEVVRKSVVEIEGLGRFEVVHQKQVQKKEESGQVLMMPPRDRIRFTPDKQNTG